MNDEPFLRSEKLVGNDKATYGVIARPATRIAYDMGISLGKSSHLCRVNSGIHAGQNGEVPCGREGEISFFSKVMGIDFITTAAKKRLDFPS